jgi:hypothetical protein
MVPAIPLARWADMRYLTMAAAGVIAAPAEMEAVVETAAEANNRLRVRIEQGD